MSAREQSTGGRLSWLRGWGWPVSWIAVIAPLVAGTIQYQWLEKKLIIGGKCTLVGKCDTWLGTGPGQACWECSMRDVFPTLLPGLLNLGAFLWLLSSSTVTRRVAFVAGVLGAVRIAVPALLYALAGSHVTIYRWPDQNTYVRGDSLALSPVLWSFGLWWLTVIGCTIFAVVIAERNKTAPGQPWWQHEAAIAWALLLFFPLGIFMMWRYAPWRKEFKWMWTGVAVLVVLIIVASAVGAVR